MRVYFWEYSHKTHHLTRFVLMTLKTNKNKKPLKLLPVYNSNI